MRGVRAVVTGSAGFIGSHLVEALDHAGAGVVGLDRLAPAPGAAGTHLQVELTDRSTRSLVSKTLAGADVVFHLAGRGGVREGGPSVDAARRRDNPVAAATVVSLTPPDCRLIVSSSSSVYGGARIVGAHVVPSREGDPLEPRGGYARSKVLVEQLCRSRRDRGGDLTVVRPFTVTGPGQRPDMAVSRWLHAARAGLPLQVLGSMERRRDVTDVRDVARVLVELAGHCGPDVVNVGTGQSVTLADLLEAVLEAVGRPAPIEILPADSMDPPATCADTTVLGATLGWVPVTHVGALVAAQLRAAVDARPPVERVGTVLRAPTSLVR